MLTASTTAEPFDRPAADTCWSAVWPLMTVVLISTCLDVLFFTGFYCSDDAEYFDGAYRLVRDGWLGPKPELSSQRLTMVGWNALIIALFGPHVQIVAASYIVLHQVLNLLTFLLGRMLWDSRVGLIGAWLLGTLPMAVIYSSQILPDIPMAIYTVLALIAVLSAYRCAEANQLAWMHAKVTFGGACVGLSYLTKETGLILLPFFGVLWAACEWRWMRLGASNTGLSPALKRAALFLGGFIAIFLAEWALLSLLTGGSFFRASWLVEDSSGAMEDMVRKYGTDPLARWSKVKERLREDFFPANLALLALMSFLFYPFLRSRSWSIYLLPLWMFGYMTWGTASLSSYSPPSIQTRYYLPIFPFLVLVVAFVLWRVHGVVAAHLRGAAPRRIWTAIGGAFIALQPLVWPMYPDRWAGRSYRADVVGAITRATRAALTAGEEPVILSGTCAAILAPMLHESTNPALGCSLDLTVPELHAIAKSPRGAAYIEVADRTLARMGRFAQPTIVDRCLQGLLSESFTFAQPMSELGSAHAFWSADPRVPHEFSIGEYGFTVVPIGEHRNAASRIDDVLATLGNTARLARRASASESAHWLRLGVMPPRAASPSRLLADLSSSLPARFPRAQGDACEKSPDGRFLRVVQPNRSFLWYLLPMHHPEVAHQLPADGRYEVLIDATITGTLSSELVATLSRDPAGTDAIGLRRLRLLKGANVCGIRTGPNAVYLRTPLKLIGSGTIAINRFELLERP